MREKKKTNFDLILIIGFEWMKTKLQKSNESESYCSFDHLVGWVFSNAEEKQKFSWHSFAASFIKRIFFCSFCYPFFHFFFFLLFGREIFVQRMKMSELVLCENFVWFFVLFLRFRLFHDLNTFFCKLICAIICV